MYAPTLGADTGFAAWTVWRLALAMRNIFDQYEQPENRATHALTCALSHEPALLRPFLRWVGLRDVPKDRLHIVQQQAPGVEVSGEETTDERRSLPDLCVFNDARWAAVFEAKVQSTPVSDQLRRHIRTAERMGFVKPQLVLLVVDRPSSLHQPCRVVLWRDVYAWFHAKRWESAWARRFVEYLEVFEANMVARDYEVRGTMTKFSGVRFDEDHPYTYREAKRLLGLLCDELQARRELHQLGLDPKGARRSAITNDLNGPCVWDLMPLRAAKGAPHTRFPHLGIAIYPTHVKAMLSIPNEFRRRAFRSDRDAGVGGLGEALTAVERASRPVLRKSPKSKVVAMLLQRHFPTQRVSVEDAALWFDLRTGMKGGATGVKRQPEWLDALRTLLVSRDSNLHMEVAVQLRNGCPLLGSPAAVTLITDCFVAMKPALDCVFAGRTKGVRPRRSRSGL